MLLMTGKFRELHLFKRNEMLHLFNYRPISLLSLIGKLLEWVIHTALMDHVLSHSILSTSQYGFRPQSSTQEALLSLTKVWHNSMEGNGCNVCVFLDVAKAFDSVPHDRVIAVLSITGVSGKLLDWFRSYLSNCHQFIAIQGVSSSPAAVTSGVPQGSILGPLLFTLVFGGVLNLSTNTNMTGFADDLTYTKAIYIWDERAGVKMGQALITNWLGSKLHRLKLDKVKSMLISRKRNQHALNISLNGHCIKQVNCFKLLGVTISKDLSW